MCIRDRTQSTWGVFIGWRNILICKNPREGSTMNIQGYYPPKAKKNVLQGKDFQSKDEKAASSNIITVERQAPKRNYLSEEEIDGLLRGFDLDPRFGPCIGMTRWDRYQRAKNLGLNPPLELEDIIEATQTNPQTRESLFSRYYVQCTLI
eukprot:TRINITY_DN2352_c0_g1_i1.p1 TRINITY_DN2352_c0_g1~~TRINITY_DN2352_c0_g1_i1.p1  ORF type:complete len:176 (+),score=20.14 TRINITY_DN2352_c0_g1_i1:81-530(+)